MLKYKIGDIVTGKVTGIEQYGIFLLIDDSITGLIHISEITDSFVRNIHDYVDMNEMIRAKVIGIDSDSDKLKLSIKNFDYSDNRNKNVKIEETKTGFDHLENQLPQWISDKMEELEKSEKK